MVPPMTKSEAALCTSHAPFFETGRIDAQEDVPISELEAAFNEDAASAAEVATVIQEEVPVKFESPCIYEKGMIARINKSTV